MKKKVVLGAALMMMPLVSFAGGYLTNTNQHAAFLRSLSRGAAIDIDGALSNPAGLSFLPTDGFRVGVSIQSAFQTRDIDASFGTYYGFDPVNKVTLKRLHADSYSSNIHQRKKPKASSSMPHLLLLFSSCFTFLNYKTAAKINTFFKHCTLLIKMCRTKSHILCNIYSSQLSTINCQLSTKKVSLHPKRNVSFSVCLLNHVLKTRKI